MAEEHIDSVQQDEGTGTETPAAAGGSNDLTFDQCKEKLAQAIKNCERVDTIRSEQCTVGRWMVVWFENWAKVKVPPSSQQT